MTKMLEQSDLIGVVASDVALYYQEHGLVAILPVELPCKMDAFGLITRTDRLLAPAAQVMLRAIKAEEELVDRSASPWDNQPRRPSHNDKRKALQREVLRNEIEEALAGRPTKERFRALAERLLALAA